MTNNNKNNNNNNNFFWDEWSFARLNDIKQRQQLLIGKQSNQENTEKSPAWEFLSSFFIGSLYVLEYQRFLETSLE